MRRFVWVVGGGVAAALLVVLSVVVLTAADSGVPNLPCGRVNVASNEPGPEIFTAESASEMVLQTEWLDAVGLASNARVIVPGKTEVANGIVALTPSADGLVPAPDPAVAPEFQAYEDGSPVARITVRQYEGKYYVSGVAYC